MKQGRTKEKLCFCIRIAALCLLSVALSGIMKPDTVFADVYIGPDGDFTLWDWSITSGENWSYDKETDTLYLSGIEEEGNIIRSNGSQDTTFNIVVKGQNTISQIDVNGNLNISGDGTLVVKNEDTATENRAIISFGDYIRVTDTTLDIQMKTKRGWPQGIYINSGKVILKNCELNCDIEGNAKKKVGDCISTDEIAIQNSTVKLNGTAEGIYLFGDSKSYIKNSTVEITLNTLGGNAAIQDYSTSSLLIENSTITTETINRGFLLSNDSTTIRNSTLIMNATGSEYEAMAIWCPKCTIENSTIKAKGKNTAISCLLTTLRLKSGTIIAQGGKGSGIEVGHTNEIPNNSQILVEGGSIKASGKKYGIDLWKLGTCKIEGGKVTLTGKKAACSKVSKLSTGKKSYIIKAGSSASKAKKVTSLKNSYKYIQIKKK